LSTVLQGFFHTLYAYKSPVVIGGYFLDIKLKLLDVRRLEEIMFNLSMAPSNVNPGVKKFGSSLLFMDN
jgi:hypothetical protein